MRAIYTLLSGMSGVFAFWYANIARPHRSGWLMVFMPGVMIDAKPFVRIMRVCSFWSAHFNDIVAARLVYEARTECVSEYMFECFCCCDCRNVVFRGRCCTSMSFIEKKSLLFPVAPIHIVRLCEYISVFAQHSLNVLIVRWRTFVIDSGALCVRVASSS